MQCQKIKQLKFIFFISVFFLLATELKSQSLIKNFRSLSSPEKLWVCEHPFIAKKAFHCTQRAQFVTDSLNKNGILKDGNGGQLDAFRHTYWMGLLVQKISPHKADQLGKLHEDGNHIGFLKGKTEDSLRADSMMCVMDLKNDSAGIELGKKFKSDTAVTKISLEQTVLDAVKSGKLFMIKKDALGNWQDATGRKINLELYRGKWFIPKVLVRSDYKQPRS
jgi:hypothetical protein